MKYTRIILLMVLFSFAYFSYSAEQLENKTSELTKITYQILGLRHHLSADQQNRQDLVDKLKQTEITIGHLSNKLSDTDAKLSYQQQQLTTLKAQEIANETQLENQQFQLAEQIRAQYILGQHQYIKLLLNEKNPANLDRMLEYYSYINRARLQLIKQLAITQTLLRQTEQAINTHTQKLLALDAEEQQEKSQLQQEFWHRKAVLENLNKTIQTRHDQLLQLMDNKQTLEKLIAKLKAERRSLLHPKIPFAKMHGKLTWPVKGRIIEAYGTPIDNSELTFNGILIQSPIHEPVRAVYPGQVIFADWLRGVGLLVILDHGHGFMSLYGHDNALKVKVGDYVAEGDIIATVGTSGGVSKSGLYFQIRENGKPLNPRVWLR